MLLIIDMKTSKYLTGAGFEEGEIIRLAEKFEEDMIQENDSLEKIFTVENFELLHNCMSTYRKGVIIFPNLEFALYFNEDATTKDLNDRYKNINIHDESMYGIDIETRINTLVINKPQDLIASPVIRTSFLELSEHLIVCDSANIIRAGLFLKEFDDFAGDKVVFENISEVGNLDIGNSKEIKGDIETFRSIFNLPVPDDNNKQLASYPRISEEELDRNGEIIFPPLKDK